MKRLAILSLCALAALPAVSQGLLYPDPYPRTSVLLRPGLYDELQREERRREDRLHDELRQQRYLDEMTRQTEQHQRDREAWWLEYNRREEN